MKNRTFKAITGKPVKYKGFVTFLTTKQDQVLHAAIYNQANARQVRKENNEVREVEEFLGLGGR